MSRSYALKRRRDSRRQLVGALNTLGKAIAAAELHQRSPRDEVLRARLREDLSLLDAIIRSEAEGLVEQGVRQWEAKDHPARPAEAPARSDGATAGPASTATTDSCAA